MPTKLLNYDPAYESSHLGTEETPEILFVSSFPPRECGIATYTNDLIQALQSQFDDTFLCTRCALESNLESPHYTQQPEIRLNTDETCSFSYSLHYINHRSAIKLVVIQHEFGFFVSQEKAFMHWLEGIKKPVVLVCHTVLPQPNDHLRMLVTAMAYRSAAVIVMTKNAATILSKEYHIPSTKIHSISHGTHLVDFSKRKKLRYQFHTKQRKVLSTFGLLSSGKSIETTLRALPTIIRSHPEVLFLILGKTHPSIVNKEGDIYRKELENLVETLQIKPYVQFVNEYLSLATLLNYLLITDIYLFTSNDPGQAVSGTFSYALSSGCPVISTPIPHAKEVLHQGNGILFDFNNSEQLAEATLTLLNDENRRQEIALHASQTMASTAWQNSAIAHANLFQKLCGKALHLSFRLPEMNLKHIRYMTTSFGIIQFAKQAEPDLHTGYTLDDNARALLFICQCIEVYPQEEVFELFTIYFNNVKYCQQPDGRFLNYVNENLEFTEQNEKENLEDSHGRAVWALGYVLAIQDKLPKHIAAEAESMIQKVIPHILSYHSTRSMAFAIKGLYYQNTSENSHVIAILANRMVAMYKHESTADWQWFEGYLTYGNSVLSEALLYAYHITNNKEYLHVAVESFNFLLSKTFINDHIKVISNNGWHVRDGFRSISNGGEQPIDVAYTMMALEQFYNTLHEADYDDKLKLAFSWFLGKNHLHQIMYNPCTGGCYDGLEATHVNLNQGAESTLSYLLARLVMERVQHSTLSRIARFEIEANV